MMLVVVINVTSFYMDGATFLGFKIKYFMVYYVLSSINGLGMLVYLPHCILYALFSVNKHFNYCKSEIL